MNTRHYELVRILHERFGKKINNLAMEDYMDVVEKFPVDLVSMVVKEVRKSAKSMPTPGELEQACIGKKSYFESKTPTSPADLICRYFDPVETDLSKSLCQKFDGDWAEVSISQLGKAICPWHQDVMHAKAFPDSMAAIRVKHDLENAKLKEQSGEEDFFRHVFGFNPLREKGKAREFLANIGSVVKNVNPERQNRSVASDNEKRIVGWR